MVAAAIEAAVNGAAFFLVVAIVASACDARARAPSTVQLFEVEHEGQLIVVHASATVQADASVVWRTLVDYNRLQDFIPDMRASELLQRHGDDVIVRQIGRAGLGPIAREFGVTLAVHETPMREIAARAVDGDFRRFDSKYLLSQADAPGATRIDYFASMEPRDGIPPLVGVPLIGMLMRREFDALLGEMARRAN